MAERALAERHLAYIRRGRYLLLDEAWQDRLTLKWAETLRERQEAFSLVHDEYLRQGYIPCPTRSGMIYRLHHLLPTSLTLLLKDRDTTVGTLTIVRDMDLFGLPMDKVYGEELKILRRQGRRLAELSALAVRRSYCLQSLFMLLVRAAYVYATKMRVTDFCIMVNPRHADFYRSIFLFEDLGPVRPYPFVNAPAVALRADLVTFPERIQKLLQNLASERSVYHFLTETWEAATGWNHVRLHLDPPPRSISSNQIRQFLIHEPSALEDLNAQQRKNVAYLCPVDSSRVH